MALVASFPKQRAARTGLCLLGALAGCSVVLEGTGSSNAGPQRDGPPQVTSPGGTGGFQGGPGGPAAAGGSGGAGQIGGGLAGATGGGTTGGTVNGELGGLGMNLPTPPACSLAGNFALAFALDVVWAGTTVDGIVPVIDEGQGTLSFVLLGKFHPTAEGVQGTVRVCDTIVPDFTTSTIVSERYAARFAEQMWDSVAMPSFSFMARQTCDGPTCWWESQRIHAQLGTQLDSPASAWPVNAASAFWPDHDGDRLPGITAQMLGAGAYSPSGEPYSHPPVHPLFFRRVSSVMLGLRMQLLLLLEQTDCNHLRGKTEEARVDSRAVGCSAETAPTECSGPELAFFDANLPVWAVSNGTIEGVRMEADATCAAARAAFR